jgi:pantetheine-phosphate adenylyltransferase
MKRLAIYPGTFDPITNGHIDVIQRTLKIFDEIIVAVGPSGKETLFSTDERLGLIRESVKDYKGTTAEAFNSLLIDFARRRRASALVRGLRAVSDFEHELQMALMNRRLDANIETVFMMPSEDNTFLSSTLIKEVASFGGDIVGLVPGPVEEALRKRFMEAK